MIRFTEATLKREKEKEKERERERERERDEMCLQSGRRERKKSVTQGERRK